MSCVIGLGNVIKSISFGNILYYKTPIQNVHLLKSTCVMRTISTFRGKIKDLACKRNLSI